MSCKLVTATAGLVHRIGRAPDPWALPDWKYAHADGTFGNRWDDPNGIYRVGYASSQRYGTFVETLSRFRPDPRITADAPSDEIVDALVQWTASVPASPVPGTLDVASWTSARMIGTAEPRGGFADVSHSQSMAEMTKELGPLLISYNLREIDGDTLRSPDRALTQQISKYLFDCASDIPTVGRQYDGIRYMSRLGDDIVNWALFEPIGLENITETSISVDDMDLLAVADRYGLVLV